MRPVHPFAAFLLLVAAPLVAQEKVDFARDVQPILSRSCYECHGNPATDLKGPSKRPKGNLRLDGKSYMLERHGEAVLTAGKPASSLLYELIALPKGDPDLMPPEGGPLKADEQALIRRWIEEGADFGAWEGNKPGAGQSPVPAAAPPPPPPASAQTSGSGGGGVPVGGGGGEFGP